MSEKLLHIALPAHIQRGFCPSYEGETVTYYINKTKRIQYEKKHRHQMKPFKPKSHLQADRALISELTIDHLKSNSKLLKKGTSYMPQTRRLSNSDRKPSPKEEGRRSLISRSASRTPPAIASRPRPALLCDFEEDG